MPAPTPADLSFARFHQQEAAKAHAKAQDYIHALTYYTNPPSTDALLREAAIHRQQCAAEWAAGARHLMQLEN